MGNYSARLGLILLLFTEVKDQSLNSFFSMQPHLLPLLPPPSISMPHNPAVFLDSPSRLPPPHGMLLRFHLSWEPMSAVLQLSNSQLLYLTSQCVSRHLQGSCEIHFHSL